ncbi:CDP-diacylglycerol--serine O-phosphatidyltransferase [Bacteroidota bacterium]|nr:CDP-diacylglycerol--serine O-phosphatidyltransferase [Bacteroidota bacterium]
MNSKILNIANFFTILNLLCGLIAIVFFSNGLVNFGCLFIIFASFFDFLDGYFARKLNISSDFGKQADSLSDMISFGVAPAILLFDITKGILKNNLDYTNEIQIVLASSFVFIYSVAALIRLSLFNNQSTHFNGIPSPVAALTVILLPFVEFEINLIIISCYVFILSFLMIMNLQIISIKKINKNTIYFLSILLVLSIFLIVFFKFTAVPLILASYILLSTIFVKNEYL